MTTAEGQERGTAKEGGHSSAGSGTPGSLALGGTLHWQEDTRVPLDTYMLRWFIFLKELKLYFKAVGTLSQKAQEPRSLIISEARCTTLLEPVSVPPPPPSPKTTKTPPHRPLYISFPPTNFSVHLRSPPPVSLQPSLSALFLIKHISSAQPRFEGTRARANAAAREVGTAPPNL